MKKPKLSFPIILFVPSFNDSVVAIVETINVSYVCGHASLNISWRFNDPDVYSCISKDEYAKIEQYITSYVMDRI